MEEKTFKQFVEFVSEKWGYRVYKTSPETALIVGKFEPEEIVEPEDDFVNNSSIKFEEPDYTNQIKTTQLIDIGDGKLQCATCGYIYYGTPRSISCIGCGKFFSKEVIK